MEPSPKFYGMGLWLGILSPNDIQSWVNTEITNSSNPSDIFIELAYSSNKGVKDIYSLVSSIDDPSEDYRVLRNLLGFIKDSDLDNLEFCRKLARGLYDIWSQNNYESPDDLKLIGFLDDEYSLAAQGINGTLDGWHIAIKEFVHGFR